MPKHQKIHLFNCDRTYKLDSVENFINTAKSELGLELSTQQQYFSLSQMTEWSNKTIPELDMDVAVFVVHAHESRLSINEENAGIGYAKIYRALLQKTDGKVIIVIGGDDSYKDEDEEDKQFISRWARRKISSQFSEECMDGRKSFIFSWDKKHREIHEKALLHFLDPNKKGLKFEYQPPKRSLPPRPTTPPPERHSVPEVFSKPYSSLPAEGLYAGERVQSTKPDVPVERREHRVKDQGARPKEKRSSSTYTTKHPKDLTILGCKVSDKSLEAVKRVFDDFRPSLNISTTDTPLQSFSPLDAKSYLMEAPPRFCVLLVDAATVQDAYKELPKKRGEYEDLLRTAAEKVAEKVIVVICGDCALPSLNDEVIFAQTIKSILKDKGFVVCLKDNHIAVEPTLLLQMILSPKSSTVDRQPQTRSSDDMSRPTKTAQASANVPTDRQYVQNPPKDHGMSHPPQETLYQDPLLCDHPVQQLKETVTTPPTGRSSSAEFTYPRGEMVMLKTRLLNGKISYQRGHVEHHYPGFQVPEYITTSLSEKYSNMPEAVVKIMSQKSGGLRWFVDEKSKWNTNQQRGRFDKTTERQASREEKDDIKLKENETVVLKTRIRYGQISMESDALKFKYPGWKTPEYIRERLADEFWAIPDGELFVISDEKGNLRHKVKVKGTDNARGTLKKVRTSFKNTFS